MTTPTPAAVRGPWTAGPWKVEFAPVSGNLCVVSEDAWICGQLSNQSDMEIDEAEANARLIAAAPALADALEGDEALISAAQEIISRHLEPLGPSAQKAMAQLIELFDGPRQREVQGKARAALAAAGGRK